MRRRSDRQDSRAATPIGAASLVVLFAAASIWGCATAGRQAADVDGHRMRFLPSYGAGHTSSSIWIDVRYCLDGTNRVVRIEAEGDSEAGGTRWVRVSRDLGIWRPVSGTAEARELQTILAALARAREIDDYATACAFLLEEMSRFNEDAYAEAVAAAVAAGSDLSPPQLASLEAKREFLEGFRWHVQNAVLTCSTGELRRHAAVMIEAVGDIAQSPQIDD